MSDSNRKVLLQELHYELNSLTDMECHNIFRRVSLPDMEKLRAAIYKAKQKAISDSLSEYS
jgi:hypothetical protein